MEESVHFDYVGVVCEQVYLYLLYELVDHQTQILFFYLLYRNQPTRLTVHGWEYLTETALALATAQSEVFDAQLALLPPRREHAAESFGCGYLLVAVAVRVGLAHDFVAVEVGAVGEVLADAGGG